MSHFFLEKVKFRSNLIYSYLLHTQHAICSSIYLSPAFMSFAFMKPAVNCLG
ncbi:hypothetical protein SAMN06269250_2025 [Spirosoma fluviale]|uniref:Uncharacterized protein n=1 Tax=Spirosoma fluviale TaxID=1597977 RepID=A0A286FH36_9BACT|nr:hypothetical protein SAMN06269250_2025 [Spirosoma fluviale]